MTGFTRLATFVSLITVVAAVTVGGWDMVLAEPVAAASQAAYAQA